MPLKPRRVIPAFASPIMEFDDPQYGAHRENIIAECQTLKAREEGIHRSNQAGSWHSADDLFRQKSPGLTHVQTFIRQCVQSAMSTLKADSVAALDMTLVGWVNINAQHAMNAPHNHPKCFLSGCYYARVPQSDKASGLIEFIDPRVGANMILTPYVDFKPSLALRPKGGSLVLFPSFLKHWVYPNLESEERISIAFNAELASVRPD